MNETLKRINLLLWGRRMVAFIILDALLAYAILWLFDDAFDPGVDLYEIAIGVALVWFGGLLFACRSWLWMLASLFVVEPKLMRATFLETLRLSQLPPPSKTYYSARFDYLENLANDDAAEVQHRLRAATLFGFWSGVMKVRGISAGLLMTQAWDAALLQYDAESRRSS